MRSAYVHGYVQNHLMRNVTELGQVHRTEAFRVFLSACAALTGQQVNYSKLAETAGISQTTAKEWLQLLVSLGVICLLRPFATNRLKRLARTPKLYFCDTGLSAYLCRWPSSAALMTGPTSGAFFENFLILDMIKVQSASSEKADFSCFRNQNGKEIDLLIERAGLMHPVEVKQSALPSRREVQKFGVLEQLKVKRGG